MQLFEDELNSIKNEDIKKFTEFALSKVNPIVWEKPSSSSGKYHPPQANGYNGLYRHTRATVYFAVEWARVFMLDELETDIAISASVLHDCMKYGPGATSKYCTNEHPQDAAKFIELLLKTQTVISPEVGNKIVEAIRNHMGQWASHKTMRFPEDFDKISQVVHLADMAASRKAVSLDFLEENLLG